MAATPMLFVHGFWHAAWCWTEVLAHVTRTGRVGLAVDLPGHGLRARRPASATARPFNPQALATEPSPVAGVDLDQAGDFLVEQIKLLGGGRPVTVVAHSMGGTALTRAAQQAPELVSRAVYLAAFMPASDTPAIVHAQTPQLSQALRADPAAVGALRLDVGSTDPGYRQALYDTFYGGVEPMLADAAMSLLSPDAPLRIALGTTRLTCDGWGSVPRTYIKTDRDVVIPPAVQERLIADADAAFPANPTHVLGLDASHSPFLSMPGKVADIVCGLG
ncbi:alpha/beta fold hydrolase [Dactylosporangium sp. NPDC000555]|uniref:alpha/beta fold hydrolase n=1 Tax=Dactylosporangium sp. NPDC000555 TaxID=3154260 RepID=UPI0033270CAF